MIPVGAEQTEKKKRKERRFVFVGICSGYDSAKFCNVTLARNCTEDTGSTVCEIFCYLSPPFLGGTLSFRSSRTRPYSSPESPVVDFRSEESKISGEQKSGELKVMDR